MSATTAQPVTMEPPAKRSRQDKKKDTKKEDKPKRSPNKWLVHYHAWRKANEAFCKEHRDVKLWVAEAKKTYEPVVHTFTCKKCKYVNVL